MRMEGSLPVCMLPGWLQLAHLIDFEFALLPQIHRIVTADGADLLAETVRTSQLACGRVLLEHIECIGLVC